MGAVGRSDAMVSCVQSGQRSRMMLPCMLSETSAFGICYMQHLVYANMIFARTSMLSCMKTCMYFKF